MFIANETLSQTFLSPDAKQKPGYPIHLFPFHQSECVLWTHCEEAKLDFAADVNLWGMRSGNDFLRRDHSLFLRFLWVNFIMSQASAFPRENLNIPKPHKTIQLKKNTEVKTKFISLPAFSPSSLLTLQACSKQSTHIRHTTLDS